MKLMIMFSYVAVLQLYAGVTHSQNMPVSLLLDNVTVEEAINTIEKEMSYSFLFTDKSVDTGRKISIHVSNGKITDILHQLLHDTDIGYQIIDRQIILAKSKSFVFFGQDGKKTVTGTVVDAGNEPVIGANIMEKGTANGTVTDVEGNFSLTVAEGAVLQASFIGYITQEVSVLSGGGQTPCNQIDRGRQGAGGSRCNRLRYATKGKPYERCHKREYRVT
ncbi:MAG: carboxypeptidase-like regulatory domain-containing protein [Tannerella sp.]|nr:carboxypeptidase-like regulatory domain-containing protein [Tannerella sp.]